MSDEWVESNMPDLTGMTLEQIRTDPRLEAVAKRLAEKLVNLPDDGVIVCGDPLQIEVPGSSRARKKR